MKSRLPEDIQGILCLVGMGLVGTTAIIGAAGWTLHQLILFALWLIGL